jgi:hypothetical protein
LERPAYRQRDDRASVRVDRRVRLRGELAARGKIAWS